MNFMNHHTCNKQWKNKRHPLQLEYFHLTPVKSSSTITIVPHYTVESNSLITPNLPSSLISTHRFSNHTAHDPISYTTHARNSEVMKSGSKYKEQEIEIDPPAWNGFISQARPDTRTWQLSYYYMNSGPRTGKRILIGQSRLSSTDREFNKPPGLERPQAWLHCSGPAIADRTYVADSETKEAASLSRRASDQPDLIGSGPRHGKCIISFAPSSLSAGMAPLDPSFRVPLVPIIGAFTSDLTVSTFPFQWNSILSRAVERTTVGQPSPIIVRTPPTTAAGSQRERERERERREREGRVGNREK